MDAPIDRSSQVPVWHQIEQALAHDIATGVLAAGSRLPNEVEVAARFGVHRHTARRALATLAEKGAVRIRRGLGTFVEPPVLTYPITGRTRFTATLREQNREASHELLETVEMAGTDDVAGPLALLPGDPVTMLRTLGLADGVPVNIAFTYLPASRFPGAAALYRELRSITAVFARFGLHDYRRQTTSVTSTLPSEEEATLLRQSRRTPVLAVASVDADDLGHPVSFSRVRFAGERVQLVVDSGG